MARYYIASCVFTSQFPELSLRIQDLIRARFGLTVVRCCLPNYKIRDFESRMPEGPYREAWQALPDSAPFTPEDEIYSLCHNCNNIIEEMHEGVHVRSLWELIDETPDFPLPDLSGRTVTVQDCWRSRDRASEQAAVRSLLAKMHLNVLEAPVHHEATRFCGVSLYRPQPPRNPRLAPKHYVEGTEGLCLPHTPEEQEALMRGYVQTLPCKQVLCYCHYCLEGLRLGGADAKHLAELLF